MAEVLLIEPDRIIAGAVKDYFAKANHEVAVHHDLQQAVASADKQKPAVVITELQLAGRSGVEFLYEFRSYPDWQAIPVIILTTLTSEELQDYADIFKDLNVSAVLHKPHTGLARLLSETERVLAPVKV
jgi:DNA-binding response OmpR family regulator